MGAAVFNRGGHASGNTDQYMQLQSNASVLQDYWNEPQVSFTPLLTAIHSRKIGIFSRGILNLLTSKSGDPRTARLDADIALRLLRNRMLPEAQAISGPDAAGARAHLIRVVLELLCAEDSKEITNWASSTVVSWYREGAEWKLSFDKRVEQLVRFFWQWLP